MASAFEALDAPKTADEIFPITPSPWSGQSFCLECQKTGREHVCEAMNDEYSIFLGRDSNIDTRTGAVAIVLHFLFVEEKWPMTFVTIEFLYEALCQATFIQFRLIRLSIRRERFEPFANVSPNHLVRRAHGQYARVKRARGPRVQ